MITPARRPQAVPTTRTLFQEKSGGRVRASCRVRSRLTREVVITAKSRGVILDHQTSPQLALEIRTGVALKGPCRRIDRSQEQEDREQERGGEQCSRDLEKLRSDRRSIPGLG